MNLLSILETKVYAGESVGIVPITGVQVDSVTQLVTVITNVIIVVGVAIVVVMLALGFVKYISSQGDKNAVDSAQKTLTYAVIGGVGLLIVYGLRSILLTLIAGEDISEAY